MLSRAVNQSDWEYVVPFLVEAILLCPNLLNKNIDIEAVLANFMACSMRGGAVIIDEKYFVVYDFCGQWYAPSVPVITEQVVLCIDPNAKGTLFSVLKFFHDEKARLEADKVLIGDLLSPDPVKYGRILERVGFQKVNSLYAM